MKRESNRNIFLKKVNYTWFLVSTMVRKVQSQPVSPWGSLKKQLCQAASDIPLFMCELYLSHVAFSRTFHVNWEAASKSVVVVDPTLDQCLLSPGHFPNRCSTSHTNNSQCSYVLHNRFCNLHYQAYFKKNACVRFLKTLNLISPNVAEISTSTGVKSARVNI